MLNFSEITPADIPVLREYLAYDDSGFCDYTCGVVFTWKDALNLQFALQGDRLFLKNGFQDRTRFYMPCGPGLIQDAAAEIIEYCALQKIPMRFVALSEQHVQQLSPFLKLEDAPVRDYADYVYSAQQLLSLSGKALHPKRTQLAGFSRKYPTWRYLPLIPEHMDRVLRFFEEFCRQVPAESASEITERACTLSALSHFHELPFLGGFLEVSGKVAAFTIAEQKGDTLYVHVEKADRCFEGSYTVINHAFVEDCMQKMSIQWVNREDDAGDAGLRRAKFSWKPDHLLEKRIAGVKK